MGGVSLEEWGEDLQMLEEKSGGTINMFLPSLLFLVVGVPKGGLEVAEEGEGKNKSKPAEQDSPQKEAKPRAEKGNPGMKIGGWVKERRA